MARDLAPGAVRLATAADAPAMAELADAKRRRCRDHARPFQIPSAGARTVHEAFLAKLVARDGFVVVVHVEDGTVDGFAVAHLGSAPPPFGSGSLFHVDDFVVADGAWADAGASLLREVTRAARAAGLEQAIVVSGPASIDPAKTAFLAGQGMRVEAEWWVKPLERLPVDMPPPTDAFDAVVGPAPPVYDPGGPTCLALRLEGPSALPLLEHHAAASGAVISIVPLLRRDDPLRRAVQTSGYTVASEWYATSAAALLAWSPHDAANRHEIGTTA